MFIEHKMTFESPRLYDEFYDTYEYYKQNLKRYTKLIRNREFDKIWRPGQFSTEPQNNLELILAFQNEHFGDITNATLNR